MSSTDPEKSAVPAVTMTSDRPRALSCNVRTLESDTATIRFTGGAGGEDDSDSDSDSLDEDVPHTARNLVTSIRPRSQSSGANQTVGKQNKGRASFHRNNNSKEQHPNNVAGTVLDKHSASLSPHTHTLSNGATRLENHVQHRKKDSIGKNGEQRVQSGHGGNEVSVLEASPAGKPSGEEVDGPVNQDYEAKLAQMRSERFNPFDKEPYVEKGLVVPCTTKPPPRELLRSQSTDSWDSNPWPEDDVSAADQMFVTELGLTEDHFAPPEDLIVPQTIEELELAISNYKELVMKAPEHTEIRRGLVKKLVDLRMKLSEAKEGVVPDSQNNEEDKNTKVVVGHHFRKRESRSSKHYCEKCASVIWGVLQNWYKCTGCGFSCHEKCLNLITRVCASIKVVENPVYILSICPEKGLAAQNYKCAECRSDISYKSGYSEPRQCDYTGCFLCEGCHWNDTMLIPARVLHNWDLEPRKVCRASKQFLKLMHKKPAIRIQDINPMLFSYVEELNEVKKLREEILIMKKYFLSCQEALKSKLLLQLKDRQHFVESSDMYSLQDLTDIAYDVMLPELAKIHTSFAQHIKTDCQLCQGKGYICEICDQNEVLFPFDNHAIVCSQCSTVLHRHCLVRKNHICPKCDRLSRRSTDVVSKAEDPNTVYLD